MVSLNNYPLGDGTVIPTDQFRKSLECFKVRESPLSVTNIAELASLNDYPLGDEAVSPTVQFK